jgi:hypothetical protein
MRPVIQVATRGTRSDQSGRFEWLLFGLVVVRLHGVTSFALTLGRHGLAGYRPSKLWAGLVIVRSRRHIVLIAINRPEVVVLDSVEIGGSGFRRNWWFWIP